jgi:hypothetical protein
MKKLFSILIISGLLTFSFAADHGMYLLTVKNIKGDYSTICDQVKESIKSAGFKLLAEREMTSPDNVKKDKKNLCGYKGKLLVFTSDEYVKMLTAYGNKYLAASMLRVGIHQTNEGIQIIIADPETINRIIFNDLKDDQYNKIVKSTLPYKNKIIDALHSLKLGANVKEVREPKRSTDDLRDASKDMIMMVGDMTFFEDEGQFPEIYSQKNDVSIEGLEKLKQKLYSNIKNFSAGKDDKDYRWTADPKEDLKWKVVGEVYSPDKKAILFGLTRNRTEGVSFYIVGDETKENSCPGLDHLTAYPIEVLLLIKDDKIVVHTPRQMLRMDMYFWDAGMAAFMDHMSMPGIIDDSIYKALFAKDKD